MSKPTVFIGSSSEGLKIARALQARLCDEADALVWTDQIFAPDEFFLDSLFRSLDKIDFAVLVLTRDDFVTQRGVGLPSSRDNVIFELGFFIGRLGRERTIVVMDEEDSPIRLPSDLSGINVARFRVPHAGDMMSAIETTAIHIREQIQRYGAEEKEKTGEAEVESYSCFISYGSQDKEFVERLYSDLQDVGIRCWLDSKELKIGDNIEVHINRAIRITDKVLLILSKDSVNSKWVQREIDGALRKESQLNRTILFPIRIDDAILQSYDQSSKRLVLSKHIGDFTNWNNADGYRQAFSQLVRDLTVSAASERDRKPSNA